MRLAASMLSILLLAMADAPGLDIGDPAPSLSGTTMIRGAPLKPGGITVVEFWATWCGPCRISIPHLAGLQRRYGDAVQIIGLSAEDPAEIKPFVAGMGDRMAYRVGAISQQLLARFMEEGTGIPYALLLDTTGRVVWQGRPTTLEAPLQALIKGTYDAPRFAKLSGLERALEGAIGGQPVNVPEAERLTTELLTLDPVNPFGITIALHLARALRKPERIRPILSRIPLDSLGVDLAVELAEDRLTEDFATRNLDLVLAFLERAKRLEPENPEVLRVLALSRYALGQVEEAAALAERATKLSTDPEIAAALDYYRQVLALRAAASTPAPTP